jgi:predicted TIM-barrel fold metal-dependent hydrolase
MMDWPIIDAHVALGLEYPFRLELPDLLARMDEHGISSAIARPTGAELAVNNRAGNDRVLAAGPRVRGLVTANPWYGAEAIDELDRCRNRGGVGLYLHPTRQGFLPTDPIAEPLIEFVRRVGWPIVFHTGAYILSDVLAVAEIARRHSDLTIVCDSAGFSDMWFELPGVLRETPNVIVCVSYIWPRAIDLAVGEFGADRVLFGSGEPRDRIGAALARLDRLELSEPERRAILHDNAVRVFKLTGEAIG